MKTFGRAGGRALEREIVPFDRSPISPSCVVRLRESAPWHVTSTHDPSVWAAHTGGGLPGGGRDSVHDPALPLHVLGEVSAGALEGEVRIDGGTTAVTKPCGPSRCVLGGLYVLLRRVSGHRSIGVSLSVAYRELRLPLSPGRLPVLCASRFVCCPLERLPA